MAAMPSIRSRLHELFGPQRVDIPDNSATLVSQGAAWIAHDEQRLVLSKPIEIELARGARLPVLQMGRPMPADGDHQHEEVHLFCTDPSDGKAKIALVTPERVSATPQASDPRDTIGMLTLEVDPTAPPLHERIKLDFEIDDDLILTVTALSSQREDRRSATYYDLEFGVGLPGGSEIKPLRKSCVRCPRCRWPCRPSERQRREEATASCLARCSTSTRRPRSRGCRGRTGRQRSKSASTSTTSRARSASDRGDTRRAAALQVGADVAATQVSIRVVEGDTLVEESVRRPVV